MIAFHTNEIGFFLLFCRANHSFLPTTTTLSATDENDFDDWGWDDQGSNGVGDVELANSRSSVDMPIPAPAGLSLKQRSPSIERKEILNLPKAGRRQSPQQIPRKQQHINSNNQGQPSSLSQPQPPAQRIATLGVTTATKKTPARPKPQEDDIFASMGLAAQPKFQASKPVVRSPSPSSGAPTTGSSWGALSGGAVGAAPRSAPAPATTTPDSDAWDDDGDLDDLLDD